MTVCVYARLCVCVCVCVMAELMIHVNSQQTLVLAGVGMGRDRRGSYTPEVLLTPLGLPRPVRPLGLPGFLAIVALVRLFGNGYAFNERLRIVLCKWCEKVGPKAQGIPALYKQHSSL